MRDVAGAGRARSLGRVRSARDDRRPHPFALTNLKKIFWPEDGYTKGDLIEYYRAISPWLLPYLRDRPVVLTRYPDGIDGKSFFQKDAPGFAPDWIRTERMWSEDTAARDRLLRLRRRGDAALRRQPRHDPAPHLGAAASPTLEQPDWCVLDLDPKERAVLATWSDVAVAAQRSSATRSDCPHFVKTTGSAGLHILVPLGRQFTYEQSRTLGELLARCWWRELPEIATIIRHVTQRGGKVYVDYLQNGYGQLIVAPFSVRPLPGAPVSVPLAWKEVTHKLDIRKHTIKTVPERMRKLKTDPLAEVLELAPDLGAALEKLMGELR